MVKIYVQTPLKFWFHIKFSREYDYVNEYPYSAKLQNMTCWTESGTQSSHIKGLDKCVWCWVCSVLSKQRGEVVWWGGGVRFTKANCGQESQWPYTDCGPAVTGMFASWWQNGVKKTITNLNSRSIKCTARVMAEHGCSTNLISKPVVKMR